MADLRSKLNRAIVAYLVSIGGDCGAKDDIFPANDDRDRDYPNTTVRSTISQTEVPLEGLRRIRVHIELRGQPSGEAAAEHDAARLQFDNRVEATKNALMQTDDGETLRATAVLINAAGRALATGADAAKNADMLAFTCQALYDAGEGDAEPEEEGPAWHEILMFDVLCSAANVD